MEPIQKTRNHMKEKRTMTKKKTRRAGGGGGGGTQSRHRRGASASSREKKPFCRSQRKKTAGGRQVHELTRGNPSPGKKEGDQKREAKRYKNLLKNNPHGTGIVKKRGHTFA